MFCIACQIPDHIDDDSHHPNADIVVYLSASGKEKIQPEE